MTFKTYFYVTLIFHMVFSESRIIDSKLGLIQGLRANDSNYFMYLGIPYARVNESNPFGESLPYPHFDTVFNAFNDTAICPQEEEFNNTIVGSLDCLHINIYVPNEVNDTSKLSVFVFIYGGFIRFGSSGRFLYGPKYLVEHGIIVVTFNYRVGPYGFFCLSIPEVSGNQGIKDQMKALKWIKRNIEAFGGDPKKITVGGNSSGAMNLDHIVHTLKEEDEKLFDKVILQSGNVYSTGIDIRPPDDSVPIKLANKLGYNASSLKDALNYLSHTDPKLVINASSSIDPAYNTCLEDSFGNIRNIPSDYPINLKVPVIKDMPVLIGNTDAETQFVYEPFTTEKMKEVDLFISRMFLDVNDTYLNEMKTIVYQFYFGEKEQSVSVKTEAITYVSDFYYYYGSKRIMEKYIENGARNIFYYIFSYDGNRNFEKYKNNLTLPGSSHADELGYLFDMSIFNSEISSNDALMVKRLTTLWANFVKYGNPTPTTTELLPVKWLPYTLDKQYYMNIDTELTMKRSPYSKRMKFWDLFYDVNRKYVIGYREKDNFVGQP